MAKIKYANLLLISDYASDSLTRLQNFFISISPQTKSVTYPTRRGIYRTLQSPFSNIWLKIPQFHDLEKYPKKVDIFGKTLE